MIREIHRSADGRISAEDYAAISAFWTARGGTAPPRHRLPTVGVIFERCGVALACAFLYLDSTGSGVGVVAWVGSSPAAAPRLTKAALEHCLDAVEALGRALGCADLLCTQVMDSGMHRLLVRHGYGTGETGLCHLLKPLAGGNQLDWPPPWDLPPQDCFFRVCPQASGCTRKCNKAKPRLR
jgi:hypothetical protein